MSNGSIVEIIGAVVDVEFPRTDVPKIYDALNIENSVIVLEVQQQLGDGIVRCIAMGSSEGMKRGMNVSNTGAAIQPRLSNHRWVRSRRASAKSSCSPSTLYRKPGTRTEAPLPRWICGRFTTGSSDPSCCRFLASSR